MKRLKHLPELPREPFGRDPVSGYEHIFPRLPTNLLVTDSVSVSATTATPATAAATTNTSTSNSSDLFPQGKNRLIHGEALHLARLLPDASIDLVYLDPPFFSGRTYKGAYKAALRAAAAGLTADNAQSARGVDVPEFSDRWQGNLASYLVWLNAHLEEVRRVLKPTGSLFLHLDTNAVHYAKVELDKFFGPTALINEIIWWYRSGGGTRRRFGRKHDTLLFYARNPKAHKFYPEAVRVPYDAKISPTRRHLFHKGGKIAPDVWDIKRPPNHSQEWLGYPTQKPEALMKRILLATTDKGDTVVDLFCGSGTTLAVAARLRRNWIGVDSSSAAITLAKKRLESAHPAQFTIEILQHTTCPPRIAQ